MARKIDVSFIIVFYSKRKRLSNLLTSISNLKTRYAFEIIVVNNSPKKISLLKKVRLIDNKENVGYARGNNLGAKKALGRYLYILNPDTKLFRNSLDFLVSFLEKNRRYGVCAPALFDGKGNYLEQINSKTITPLRYILFNTFLGKVFKPLDEKKRFGEVEVVAGSAFLIRRGLFRKLGGFDEQFFLYFEENDLCKRVLAMGYKIFIEEKAKVVHFWIKKENKRHKNIFKKSRDYYFEKHYGKLASKVVGFFSDI